MSVSSDRRRRPAAELHPLGGHVDLTFQIMPELRQASSRASLLVTRSGRAVDLSDLRCTADLLLQDAVRFHVVHIAAA